MDLLSLPTVMIENILSYLNYDEIARNRVVCKVFNDLSMRMLNRGFLMIERRHSLALKSVKGQLPRRESERRYHPLARHCDILTSIETRISMLNMTYSKFIDTGICCFIPGKVIDEIKRVLHIAETQKAPPRAHEVLQELRDISSMAIEHFDDKISPGLRQRLQAGAAPPPRAAAVFAPIAMRQELLTLRRRSILNAKLSLFLAQQYKKYHRGEDFVHILQMMEYRKIAWKQRQAIRKMSRKQKAQNAVIADLKKRVDECDIRYRELIQANQAIGVKPIPGGAAGAAARHFGSQIKLDLSVLPIGTGARAAAKLPNIKPRKPVMKFPTLSEDEPHPNAKPESNPGPSTSASPKTKAQSTLAKIRGITSEIRHLSNLSNMLENKLKRPLSISDEEEEVKRQKN